jgi:hypothetical protein
MKLFGREPALFLALFAALIQVLSTFIVPLTPEQQSLVNAGAVALAGLITAVLVHDGVQAAVLGFLQGLLSLAVGFGAHIDPGRQAVIMAAVAAGIALWVRDRVTAPVTANEVSIMRRAG